MRRILPLSGLLGLFSLASCISEFRRGRDDYYEGLHELPRDAAGAHDTFAEADEHFKAALAEGKLTTRQRIAAVSYRVRTLIELDRHVEARDLSAAPIEGYDPGQPNEGDPLALILIRAHSLDPEHAFAELLVADRKAGTLKTRRHVAWEMVHALEKMGKPESKAEAVKLCQQNAGQIDFDELKKKLGSN